MKNPFEFNNPVNQKRRQQNALPKWEGTTQHAEQPPLSGLGPPHIHLLFQLPIHY